ncbi:MAG TPA: histidine ammonia-lyase [Firmicutes bacterium]|nr:histidine ammonia-lyase [Candidatus Fermentithermobacillaceae bacterium]
MVLVDGKPKTIEEIVRVAEGVEVAVSPEARERILSSRRIVEDMVAEGRKIYGITTGFGKFADAAISLSDLRKLQHNLIVSHAVGTGDEFSVPEVRAAMFLRANALAKGNSGVRIETVERLVSLLNRGVTPVVPQKGSVGASGDLAPLAHVALVLLGMGMARFRGEVMPGDKALSLAGIEPLHLEAKEGLALTNGVQMTAAVLALAIHAGEILARSADIVASLTGQALSVITDAYCEDIVRLRPHAGAPEAAANLRALLDGSRMTSRSGEVRIQDAYTLRCIPQVHGAVRQALAHARSVVEIESGSATDNPLVLEDGRVVSGGNFHGQPLAVAADYLSLSLCSLGNISERRVFRLFDPASSGLPLFLAREGGLNSGLMMLQYTAAALCSECKVLAHPASVDTIPTSAGQEDHVSMSTIAARKAREIASNVATVLAIEYVSACQAVDFRDPSLLSPAGKAAYDLLRAEVSPVLEDREMMGDVEKARELIVSGALVEAVSRASGRIL